MQLPLRAYAINDCVLQEINVHTYNYMYLYLIITCSSSNYFFDFLHKYKKNSDFLCKIIKTMFRYINACKITNQAIVFSILHAFGLLYDL